MDETEKGQDREGRDSFPSTRIPSDPLAKEAAPANRIPANAQDAPSEPLNPSESKVFTGRKQGAIIRFDGPQGQVSSYLVSPSPGESVSGSAEATKRAAPHQTTQESVASESVAVSNEPKSDRPVRRELAAETLLTRMTWWLATLGLLVGGWVIGPAMVERFSYAHTRGQMLARYEIAKTALEGDPALTLSMTGQWVAQKVRPSVAHIRTIGMEEVGDLTRRRTVLSEGQGSGVVVAENGFLLTNEHVVADATEIWVTLSDRREYRATLVGSDSETDLAVLQIDETGLIPIEWADEESAEVGSLVWAVGSPFGLEQSTTQGIISALHRRKGDDPTESRHQDLLQSDCAINPGNSGGPLVNSQGQLVGVNTSIVGDSFCGISFSVPSVVAREILDRLLLEGAVERGFLGVEPIAVPGHLVKLYGIAEGRGAYVQHVVEGGAAERAGIQEGDIILTWDGKVIENDIILFRMVGLTRIDSQVTVGLLRAGEPMEVTVQVAPRRRN